MTKAEKLAKAHQLIGTLSQTLTELVELVFNEEAESSEQQNKKKRRDPNAPKAPASNYFLFTNSIRERIDRENPQASFAEKSKLYGLEWQKLTEEEKKPFTEKAKREREKYNKELAAYEAEHGIVHPEKKIRTEPTKPKASTSNAAKPKQVKSEPTRATVPKAKATATTAKKPVPQDSSSDSSDEESQEESSDSDSE